MIRSNFEFGCVELRASSLHNLVSALIDLFPDGPDDDFDQDAYFAVLCKVHEDSAALNILLRNTPLARVADVSVNALPSEA